MNPAPLDPPADHELRPVETAPGRWDALDGSGYGHVLGYATAHEVYIWIDGYNTGARENM